ncbi:MAG: PQQ-dependent sugar dehydrogenase [Phycisphaerae bacterium]
MNAVRFPIACLLALWLTSAAAQPVALEPGFAVSLQVSGIRQPTQITFAPDGRLFVALREGTILAYPYDTDGISGPPTTVATQVGSLLLGIAFDASGELFASSNLGPANTGFLARLRDLDHDGVFETQQRFVTNLPNLGHHNDQLAIDGQLLYVGMGSRSDDGQTDNVSPIPAATILRVDLAAVDFNSTANLPQVYARGFRNPFGIAIDRLGRLWAADNGQDQPIAQETLHLVTPGGHHGVPPNLAPPDAIAPLAQLGLGTSADGLDLAGDVPTWGTEFADNLFVVRFDFELNDPAGVGMDVVRVQFANFAGPQRPTVTSTTVFARGFYHPLDAEFDPFGNLLVLEYGSYFGPADGAIHRIARGIAPCLGDINGDRAVTLADLAILLTNFGQLSGATLAQGDLDADGDVDLIDLATLLRRFGEQCD